MGDNEGYVTVDEHLNPHEKSIETCLHIATLNVSGLISKSIIPEFKNYMNFDIIGLQETKMDAVDEQQFFEPFMIYYKSRRKVSKVKSGGLALTVKKEIDKYVTVIESKSSLVLWFKLSKKLTGTSSDILGGVIYIYPEQTKYSVEDPFSEIENELNQSKDKYCNIMLLGDFNTRTKNRKDFIQIDSFVDKEYSLDFLTQYINYKLIIFEMPQFSLERTSKDIKMNNFGYQLLDLCKSQNLFIVNGRAYLDHQNGENTCRDAM